MLPTAAASIFRLQVVFGCEHFFYYLCWYFIVERKEKTRKRLCSYSLANQGYV